METWAQAWLLQQCKTVAGVRRAVVVLGAPDRGPYRPVASWPEELEETEALNEVLGAAMAERRAVIQGAKGSPDSTAEPMGQIAVPFLFDGKLAGGIAIELPQQPERQQRGVVQLLYWGVPWLGILIGQQRHAHGRAPEGLADTLLRAALRPERFRAALLAVASELAAHERATRVSIGFFRGGRIQIQALSNSASFSKRTRLLTRLSESMEEACDQASSLVRPPPPDASARVMRAHDALAQEGGARLICTLPIREADAPVGAITLEWEDPTRSLDTEELSRLEESLSSVSALLLLKRREERGLTALLWQRARRHLEDLLGPQHLALKATLLAGLVTFAAAALIPTTYRVAADARLEGIDQRVVAAATEGFVASTSVRAGDVVSAGTLLATLDDRELSLERLGWISQRDQALKQYHAALANHDALEARVSGAQLAQAEAQVALLDEQIARMQMRAPFNGIVVSGDLSQSLGAPVRKGEVLFTLAPLDAYRVVLEVDERSIADISVGQPGALTLSAMPGQRLALDVEKITPISTAAEGRNTFRVEASLAEAPDFLRPGMEGVGKVDVARRSFLWIWTHELVDWARLWLWTRW